MTAPSEAAARFTRLEQQVVRLAVAGRERPGPTSRQGHFARRAVDTLAARRGKGHLADPRLEALRHHTARLWRGESPTDGPLLDAGFTPVQAAALRTLVATAPRRAAEKRDRLIYMSGISLALTAMTGFIGLTGALVMGV